MASEPKPRDCNRYAQGCLDCGQWVEAGNGFLYRHSGANMRRGLRRSKRTMYAYAVRCKACSLRHDGPHGRATVAVESSGVKYSGYGANTHAICGN